MCVTSWVHEELVGRLGGPRETRSARITRWYADEIARVGDQPILIRPDQWWRQRFENWLVAGSRQARLVLDPALDSLLNRVPDPVPNYQRLRDLQGVHLRGDVVIAPDPYAAQVVDVLYRARLEAAHGGPLTIRPRNSIGRVGTGERG